MNEDLSLHTFRKFDDTYFEFLEENNSSTQIFTQIFRNL